MKGLDVFFPYGSAIVSLALLIACAKAFGYGCRKMRQPAVLGEIVSGILLGPSVLHWVEPGPLTDHFGEIGAVLLMFIAGLETNAGLLRRVAKSALLVALCGVAVPMAAGYYLCRHLGYPPSVSLIVGTILISTSVSITVEVLKEMGKLTTREGVVMLGAAVLDDIIGFLALTLVLAAVAPGAPTTRADFLVRLVLKLAAFFALLLAGKFISIRLIARLKRWKARRLLVGGWLLILAFGFAYLAEQAGLTDIVGAYLIGLLLSSFLRVSARHGLSVVHLLEKVGYAGFIPVFFAGIGLRFDGAHMGHDQVGFLITLTCLAIISKIAGCGVGAVLSGMSRLSSLRVGIGMVARGEVGLIVAMIAFQRGVIRQDLLSVAVFMVFLTTLATPVLLKGAYSPK